MPLFSSLAAIAALKGPQIDIQAVRAPKPPKIDAHPTHEEWPDEAKHNGFFATDTGQPTDRQADFWLMYDDEAVYFAGKIRQDPRTILDQEYRSNVSLAGNDRMTLTIDPFGGMSTNSFSVNAAGATEIRLAGGRAAKTEWVGEFEAQAHKTEFGWEFEAKIPWQLMKLPQAGSHDVRMNVTWSVPSANASFAHRYAPRGTQDFPMWGPVLTPRPRPTSSTQILPYGYVGVDGEGRSIVNGGVDFRTPLTDKVSAVGTINPDFRNIENGILSLDFSYFDRLAAESRPFFLEGQQFRGIGQRLFASQKISDIDAGVNVYGPLDDKRQISVLGVTDFGKSSTEMASFIVQPTATTSASFNYVGFSRPGLDNHLFASAFSKQVGNVNLSVVGRASQDTLNKTGLSDSFNANYSRNGVDAGVGWETMSPTFTPRAGFLPEKDYHQAYVYADKLTRYKQGALGSFFLNVFAESLVRTDGSFYRNDLNLYTNAILKNGLSIDATIDRPNFEGSADQSFSASLAYPASNPYNRISINKTIANYGGQNFNSTGFALNYRPKKRVQASLSSQFVDFGGQATQVIGSLRWDKGKFESFGLRVVRQDSDLNWNLSYRMSGKRGVEYYVILGDPNARTFQRQFVLKVVAPITVG